ncbi:caspase family protein [Rhizobium leguminosarum bv. viciae]|uniref:caspase family protein n=1 Tax=Rhizobium ruizarguesonis TaxID=2081791 RepID=UPI00143FB0C9|nr:caspase family protein [Rhizobium ruizarguesonis]NKJ71806.1 caspase family protein [Rhizobium leguminosarum bv. viciae]NKQ77761.1 peptidase C14 [Rhizobium ruizarguesonis]
MKDRKALVVGIDYYETFNSLNGCVTDAQSVARVLSRHANGDVNFKAPRILLGQGKYGPIRRKELRDSIEKLFSGEPEIALLYFAGHGYIDAAGGFLCPSDCRDGDDGIPLDEVMKFARKSKAANKIIILDSCHGGIAGNREKGSGIAELDHGVTLLTASTEEQYAHEGGNGAPGVFTNLMVDALEGAAANLVGDITPGSVYAHIDQSLGPWGGQRPVFKTNVESFVSLRKVDPPIPLSALHQLPILFPTPDHKIQLDPSFEPERSEEQKADPTLPKPDPTNNAIFEVLQNYTKVNLSRPVGAKHMWHAVMTRKYCELTVLGKHYWRLVKDDLI